MVRDEEALIMHITPPNDSAKLASLGGSGSLRRAQKPLQATEPGSPAQPVGERHTKQQRQPKDRRHTDRRKQRHQALLDTRNPHERRKLLRREEDRQQQAHTEATDDQGIDVTV
jgi:hypothetical protein